MSATSKKRLERLETAVKAVKEALEVGEVIIVDIPPDATDSQRANLYQNAAQQSRAKVILMLPDNGRGVRS